MSKIGMIFSGGAIEDSFALEQFYNIKPEYIVGVDKGVDFLYRHHMMPNVIVGDFDSVGALAITFYRAQDDVTIHELPPEKDDTDTAIAVRMAIDANVQELWILGATGTRLDHVMANIRLLKTALDAGIKAYLVDPHNKIYLAEKEVRIQKENQFGQYFSLFAFEEQVEGLCIIGAKYPLQNFVLSVENGRCVSNEIEWEEAVITLQRGSVIVLETRD